MVDEDVAALRAAGHDVVEFSRSSDEIESWTMLGKAGLSVRPVVSPSDVHAFRSVLRSFRPQIVHLHNPFPIISPWVVRTARAEGVPVVQTVHNYRHSCVTAMHFREGSACTLCVGRRLPVPAVVHGCYQGSRVATIPMAASQVLNRGTWDLVDRFLPVGESVADSLRRLGIPPNRIEVLPNRMADPGEPHPGGAGCLFVGRLSEEKGVDLLLEAWSRLPEGHGLQLRIAGDGPLRGSVSSAAARDPSIEYLGLLAQDTLAEEYRRCALVLFPSKWFEAHPLAILSAFAHGRPVVACDLGAMRHLIDDSVGWRVAPTADAWVTALLRALSDHVTLRTYGVNARARFVADQQRGRPLIDVYREVTAVPRGHLVLVGPDGAGKTAIADQLAARAEAGRLEFQRAHFRPLVLSARSAEGSSAGTVADPQSQKERGPMRAVARTLFVWSDFLLGSFTRWRRAGRRGLLVRERPWEDQLVDRRRYRLPQSLFGTVRCLGRLLPRADVAVLLTGDPRRMHYRKPELPVEEIEAQLTRWEATVGHVARRVSIVDTTASDDLEATVETLVTEVALAGATRALWIAPLGFPARLAMRCTDAPPPLVAMQMYPPARSAAKLAARGGALLARLGVARQVETEDLDVEKLRGLLSAPGCPLAAFASSAPNRWIVGAEKAAQLFAVAKIGPSSDDGLRNEAQMLKLLAEAPRGFDVPQLRRADNWEGHFAVVLEAAPKEDDETPSLDQIVEFCAEMYRGFGQGPLIHGDLAPWNVRMARGRLFVLDWEDARKGDEPAFDLTHYVVQSGALAKSWGVSEAADLLVGENGAGASLARLLSLEWEPFRASVEASVIGMAKRSDPRTVRFLSELRARL